MNWLATRDVESSIDAINTFNGIFPWMQQVGFMFIDYQYDLTLQEFQDFQIENAGAHRIEAMESCLRNDIESLAEAAFPLKDRPRGDRDIQSIIYHATTDNPVSPIVVVVLTEYKKPRYILLDGVHRLIGAIIRGGKIKVEFLVL